MHGVNLYVLWLEYKQHLSEGYQYSQFCYHYQQWQGSRQTTLHLEHKAGDKLFEDYAGEKLHLTDPVMGVLEPVDVFVAILGCSQLTYVCAVKSQSKADFLSCLASGTSILAILPLPMPSWTASCTRYTASNSRASRCEKKR
jgi:transposase